MMKQNRWTRRLFSSSMAPVEVHIEAETATGRSQMDEKAIRAFNAEVMQWSTLVEQELKQRISEMTGESDTLRASLYTKHLHYGERISQKKEVTSIGFHFAEEGIFIHLGVGRGYNYEQGKVILTKKNDEVWRRSPKPWFNPVIEKHIPRLQEIVMNYCGNMIVNTARIYINV